MVRGLCRVGAFFFRPICTCASCPLLFLPLFLLLPISVSTLVLALSFSLYLSLGSFSTDFGSLLAFGDLVIENVQLKGDWGLKERGPFAVGCGRHAPLPH